MIRCYTGSRTYKVDRQYIIYGSGKTAGEGRREFLIQTSRIDIEIQSAAILCPALPGNTVQSRKITPDKIAGVTNSTGIVGRDRIGRSMANESIVPVDISCAVPYSVDIVV